MGDSNMAHKFIPKEIEAEPIDMTGFGIRMANGDLVWFPKAQKKCSKD